MLRYGVGRLLKHPGRVVPAEISAAREAARRDPDRGARPRRRVTREAEALRAEARRQGYYRDGPPRPELTRTVAAAALDRQRARARRRAGPARWPRAASQMAHKIVGRAVEMAPALLGRVAARALAASRRGGASASTFTRRIARAGRDPVRARLLAGWPPAGAGHPDRRARWASRLCVETATVRIDARLAPQLAAWSARCGPPQRRRGWFRR